uniref:Uncharacterized protein n=1 Tax=Erythrolobus australicus TaxID=1077150 RepID=A0A7S1XGD6_9RHOD|mmetsp:Transcript_1778/g.4730  ORF Transcript_1778/g.4730 Transcript_1778/m.4730 type:complete len:261 (+) Transcript_1778:471-1253(+)
MAFLSAANGGSAAWGLKKWPGSTSGVVRAARAGLCAPVREATRKSTVVMMSPRKLQTETRIGNNVLTTMPEQDSSVSTRRSTIVAALGGATLLLAKRLLIAGGAPQERILVLALLMGMPAAIRCCVTRASFCVETLRSAPKSVAMVDSELVEYSNRCFWTSIASVTGLYVAGLYSVPLGAALFTCAQLWHVIRSRVSMEAGMVSEVCRYERGMLVMGGSLCTAFAALSMMPTMAVMCASLFLSMYVLFGLTQYQSACLAL